MGLRALVTSALVTSMAWRWLAPVAEGLGMRPRLCARHQLCGDLLDAGRRWRPRNRLAPFGLRCVTDARDVGYEVPDRAVGQHFAPCRHAVRAALTNAEIDVRRLAAIDELALAECGAHPRRLRWARASRRSSCSERPACRGRLRRDRQPQGS